MIHTKPIGGSSELEDDLLALLKLDWASEKRVQLELILFANNVYDFVGDIFEDDWRNLYVLVLLMLADIHYKIQDSHGLVLKLLLLKLGHFLGSQQCFKHLGTHIDLESSSVIWVLFIDVALHYDLDVGAIQSVENEIVDCCLKRLNDGFPL